MRQTATIHRNVFVIEGLNHEFKTVGEAFTSQDRRGRKVFVRAYGQDGRVAGVYGEVLRP